MHWRTRRMSIDVTRLMRTDVFRSNTCAANPIACTQSSAWRMCVCVCVCARARMRVCVCVCAMYTSVHGLQTFLKFLLVLQPGPPGWHSLYHLPPSRARVQAALVSSQRTTSCGSARCRAARLDVPTLHTDYRHALLPERILDSLFVRLRRGRRANVAWFHP